MSLVQLDEDTWVDAEAVIAIEADGLSEDYSLVTLEDRADRIVVHGTTANVARAINARLVPSPRWTQGGQYL